MLCQVLKSIFILKEHRLEEELEYTCPMLILSGRLQVSLQGLVKIFGDL